MATHRPTMTIGIEAQRLFRKNKHGMDMVALELIKKLPMLDRENNYVLFVKPGPDAHCVQPSENLKIRILNGGPYPLWEQIALPRAAREEACDLLHCTANTAPLKTSMPLVLTLHDIIYLEKSPLNKQKGSWYQRMGNTYRKWIVPAVAPKARAVITVSQFEKNRIESHFGFEPGFVSAIYNGVGEHFKPIICTEELEAIREKYRLPLRFLFFLGNTDPKKNTPNLLKAYAHYIEHNEPIPLVMPDFGQGRLDAILRNIGATHLKNHIHLTGYIVNKDLPAIYTLCQVFLYPSLRESFGIPLLEAMACGAPVVAANVSSIPEVANDAALLVNPASPQNMSQGITQMIQNKNLRNKYIDKGLKRAKQFTWENTAKNVLALYQDVVKHNMHDHDQK